MKKILLENTCREGRGEFTPLLKEALDRLEKGERVLPHPFPAVNGILLQKVEKEKRRNIPPSKSTPRGVVLKTESIKRGFGACTLLFYLVKKKEEENYNGWNFLEVCSPGANEYQRSVRPIENPDKLVGKKISDMSVEKGITVIRGKWGHPIITPSGELVSYWH